MPWNRSRASSVVLLSPRPRDRLEDLQHPSRALAAGNALAAGLALDELHEELGEVHHAGGLVHHDQAARSHDRAEVLEGLVVGGDVQVRFGHAAAGGAADLDGLALLAVGDAAADVEHDLRSVVPIGISTRPVRRTMPERAKTFVPLLPAVPIEAYQSAPWSRISGRLASVSTLLMTVGLPNRP